MLAGISMQMCSKCPPPERLHALSHTRHWSMDASMMSYSMLLQTFSRHCHTVAVRQHFESLSGRCAATL